MQVPWQGKKGGEREEVVERINSKGVLLCASCHHIAISTASPGLQCLWLLYCIFRKCKLFESDNTGSVKEEGLLLPNDRGSKAGYLARQACAGNSHLRAW